MRIVIQNVHTLDNKTLTEYGVWFMKLAGHTVELAPERRTPVSSTDTMLLPMPPIAAPKRAVASDPHMNPPAPMFNENEMQEPTFQPDVPPANQVFNQAKAPTPPAPTVPPIKTSTPLAHTELDVQGIPWDSRIHARTKSKNPDGSWKAMRGLDPAKYQQVIAELGRIASIPHTVTPPTNPVPPPKPPVAPITAPESEPLVVDGLPIEDDELTFDGFLMKIMNAVDDKKIKREKIIELCAEFGLKGIPQLATNMDLLPEFNARIDKLLSKAK